MFKLRSIALELTRRCNQHCAYCYNAWDHDDVQPESELSLAQIRELIDRILAEVELKRVTLTGGEPLLRADVLDVIDFINGRGLSVSLISNGRVVDRRLAESLAARKVDYLQVTLAGPDRRTHDLLCGEGSFQGTAAAVKELAHAGVSLGGSFLCTRENCGAAQLTFERMFQLGVRHHFALNRFNPSGRASAALRRLLPTRSDVLSALAGADRFARRHGVKVRCTMPIPHCMVEQRDFAHVRFGQCAAGTDRGEYAVDPQGRLKLCTLQQQTLGSLLQTSLVELIAGEARTQFRAMIPGFCRPCPRRAGCLGGCGAAAEWVFGRADQLDPFLAQHVMEDFRERTGQRGP